MAPPIEYAWCQFKMTSSKCPYRSKHQVIILTVYIYLPETLYITQNKHGMLFTDTRIHIVPNFAYLRRFVVVCLQGQPPQITTNHQRNVVNMQDLGRCVFRLFAKLLLAFVPSSGGGLQWFACFHCFHYLSSQILVVICGGLGWLAMVCLILDLRPTS